jgi:hypothetical protein
LVDARVIDAMSGSCGWRRRAVVCEVEASPHLVRRANGGDLGHVLLTHHHYILL